MEIFYDVLKFLHVMSFVFMSVPLFNLIVVNERAQLGKSFNYYADRYMENIIKHGAVRCFVFQATVLSTGILLLISGPLGIQALWSNWVLLTKTLLLFTLTVLLFYVHRGVQPKIERILANVTPETAILEELAIQLKQYRTLRKRLATLCLFLVITIIILGLQVYARFNPALTIVLITLAALFSWRTNRTLVRLGWG